MSEQETLVPTEIQAVEFYGDTIIGALVQVDNEARIYIPLRPICQYLGLEWSAQYRRVQRDEVLASEIQSIRIERSEFVAIMAMNSQRGDPNALCLPLDLLPGWLFGITTTRVKPELREKITRYRRECYRRLWEAFRNNIIAPQTLPPTSGAALAFELATAVQNIAREQMQLEQRMNNAAQWAKETAQWARGVDERLTALEVRLLPDAQISTSQAGELALHVKTIATALEQRGHANGYQRVYSELYRRFTIASYKSLPQSRFDEALQWLSVWYDEIAGEERI